MRWPRVAGETMATRAVFVLALACLVGVLIYLVATRPADTPTGRGEEACAYARERILARVSRMGTDRGGHSCTATPLDGDDRVWDIEGVYVSTLTDDVQPNVPFSGVVVWDDTAEAFATCIIEFRPAGEASTDVAIIEPVTRPDLCPA